jgi:hypothetical protein
MQPPSPSSLPSGATLFAREALFDLSDDDISRLRDEGSLRLSHGHRVREPWRSSREGLADGSLCLAMQESRADRLPSQRRRYSPRGIEIDNVEIGGFDDPADLAEHIWLTTFDRESFSLRLVDPRSLAECLRIAALSIAVAPAPSHEVIARLARMLEPAVHEGFLRSGYYSGPADFCSCGVWSDGASFLWVLESRPLLQIVTDSGAIAAIALLPEWSSL